MDIKVGSILKIRDMHATVIGYIKYKNVYDSNKTWTEYRLSTGSGEKWLSMDYEYNEFSVSGPDNKVRGRIGPEWHEVDHGHQVVVSCSGDVDVEIGDEADFVEYEDASEDNTLSVEIWDDGTEYSRGYYVELSEIEVTGYERPPINFAKVVISAFYAFIILLIFLPFLEQLLPPPKKYISDYVKSSGNYVYQTSITGNLNQKADVYAYRGFSAVSTDTVAKDIIKGVEGQTESVTQENNAQNGSVAIVTKKEYCLIYHPSGDSDTVYVQVSNRKYNYTSDNAPYKSSDSTTHWYRSHYYSSGYTSDSARFGSTPSAYSLYSGDTIHNIGNGYFDSYSSSVRQDSINARRASSGGISGGK